MTLTSTAISLLPPTRCICFSSRALNNFACASRGRSPISSRKRLPSEAYSNLPKVLRSAPVNAPFSWPNSSDSTKFGDMAAQLTGTNRLLLRGLSWWMNLAISSLPVPDSPVIRTAESVFATLDARSITALISLEAQTISLAPATFWISCLRSLFSTMIRDKLTVRSTVSKMRSSSKGFVI